GGLGIQLIQELLEAATRFFTGCKTRFFLSRNLPVEPTVENVQNFQKLSAASLFRQLHWAHIARHQLTRRTVRNDRKIRRQEDYW
ncbi:MAG: hypothetical protein R6U98_17825, partial [Pirellulaceae bacterium]